MQLGILLTKDHRLLSVAAILDVLETVNRFYRDEGKKEPFTIDLLHLPNHETLPYPGHTPKSPIKEEYYDLVLIPSFTGDWLSESLKANLAWVPWLQDQHKEGGAIASFVQEHFYWALQDYWIISLQQPTLMLNRLSPNYFLRCNCRQKL